MRRLRVLAGHPHLGRPNDVVREFEGVQAYVDAGFCEWIDDEPETTTVPVVVDRAQTLETTDAGGDAVETTTVRATAKPAATQAGTTVRRRGHVPADH